jgi:predicted transcriptional regulator
MATQNPKVLAAIERAKELRRNAQNSPLVTADDLDTPEEVAQKVEGELITADNPSRRLSPKHEKIVNYLVAGCQDFQIAGALGVSQSAISQEIEAHGLLQIAATRQLEKSSIFNKIDDHYNSSELKLVKKLETLIPYMTDPVKISIALRTVNAAKRRSGSGNGTQSDKTKVVHLQINSMVRNTFVFNKDNEAIAVDGRPLVSMTTAQLLKQVQEQKNEEVRDEEFQQLSQEHGSLLRHI